MFHFRHTVCPLPGRGRGREPTTPRRLHYLPANVFFLSSQPGDPEPKKASYGSGGASGGSDGSGLGLGVYFVVLIGGVLAYGAYLYNQQQATGVPSA
jgi:hypothetical protein